MRPALRQKSSVIAAVQIDVRSSDANHSSDVNDSIAAARYLASSTNSLSVKVDPKRIVITGGSAGGYTVLQSICTTSALTAFCGAISSYGISNLFNLVKDTHKFEAKYMDKLIGCTPSDEGGEKVYRDRSPIFQAERVKTPLLVSFLFAHIFARV